MLLFIVWHQNMKILNLHKYKNPSWRNHAFSQLSHVPCTLILYLFILWASYFRIEEAVCTSRFASREQRRPCIIIWYVCARAVNTCCASSMKYVLSPESDALEAFPARPCNIYVLLVTSCIAKSHFSGRSACLYLGDSFSRFFFTKKTLKSDSNAPW